MKFYQFDLARKLVGIALLSAFLGLQTGCGSTSGLTPVADTESKAQEVESQTLDLSSYSRAVIGDFSDLATENKKFKNSEKGVAKKAAYVADVQAAGTTFTGYLKAELDKLNVFDNVSVGTEAGVGEGTLLIDGEITRFARGNAAAKFLIGFGAGSTYFDATVTVRDGATGQKLGEIFVDKNSWALGGAISAAQSVEHFMRGGAEKTAKELYAAKHGEEPNK